MSRLTNILCAGLLIAGFSGLTAAPALADPVKPQTGGNCFWAHDWQGWKSPSPSVIYIRVRLHDIYRLDLSDSAYDLNWPDVHLISRPTSSDFVCSPIDLQLDAADRAGTIREPLIVRAITKLTPEEIAAIPPKFLP